MTLTTLPTKLLLPLLVTQACVASSPAPRRGSVAEVSDPPGNAKPVAAAPSTSAPPADATASSPAPVRPQSWATRLCGPGPHPAPLQGTKTAQPLPASEPTALDAKDKEFHLFEGAVWFQGALHFSDFKTSEGFPSRILKYEDGQLSVVVPDSGSNGLGLDPTGERLVAARHSTRSVSVRDESGEFQPLAALYEGKPFNSPNDLAFRSDGNLYFTDPSFQAGATPPQSGTRVYRVAPDGAVSVVDTMHNPNGVSLSPDEKTLYVAGNMEQGYVKSYPVADDGSVGEGQVFLPNVTVPDGMAIDCAGNVYVTEHTKKRIRVVSPEGKELGQITGLDRNVTNAAFGGPKHQTLFITTTGRLFQIELPLPGMPY